jgi:hypothetical protein
MASAAVPLGKLTGSAEAMKSFGPGIEAEIVRG